MILFYLLWYFCIGLSWATYAYFKITEKKVYSPHDLQIWFVFDTIAWPLTIFLFFVLKK